MTATLIDQVSGEAAFLAEGPGLFTANLNIDYLAPLLASRYVLVSASVYSQEGRKTRVRVEVSDGAEKIFAKGEALYVRPKWLPKNEKRAQTQLIDASEVVENERKEKESRQLAA